MLPSIFRILATLGAIQNRQILKNLKILKISYVFFFKTWLCTNNFSSNLHVILIRNITLAISVGIWGLGAAKSLVSAV